MRAPCTSRPSEQTIHPANQNEPIRSPSTRLDRTNHQAVYTMSSQPERSTTDRGDNRLSTMITHRASFARDTRRRRLAACTFGRRPLARLLSLNLAVLLVFQAAQISLASNELQHDSAAAGSQKQTGEPATLAAAAAQASVARSTQASVERQVDAPGSSSIVSAPSVAGGQTSSFPSAGKDSSSAARASNEISSAPNSKQAGRAKPTPQSSQQQKKYLASQQQNYDKYQLKATNSQSSAPIVGSPSQPSSAASSDTAKESSSAAQSSGDTAKESNSRKEENSDSKQSTPSEGTNSQSSSIAHKKAGTQQANHHHNRVKSSSFSLLKKLLPSFMTSAGPAAAAAAAAAAASAVVDKHQMSRSRSSSSSVAAASSSVAAPLSVGSFTGSADGPLSRASGKLINYILSGSKKSAAGGAVPDHAPFFIRKPSIDRQAGFASGLLSNPLSLGLLFSAPLIPSLLLTPLAIAGLSPAMSAINNFFGDDEEASTPASSPLSMLTGPSSPLSSILQGSSSPFLQAASSASAGSNSNSDSQRSSLALQAVQSFLGPTSTTEKPLFNPGMFASQGIQNAAASINSGSSSSTSGALSQASNGNTPIRNLLGGNFIQTAASMISPSFAPPPSSGSSADSDDGPGLMEMASSVFDKVSNYMTTDKDSIGTASANPNAQPASALANLVGLSSFSPFQLSSLFASSPIGSAIASSSGSSGSSGSSSHSAPTQQRAGFFSTLKNVYELFTSSFLRRQADVGDTNECQQRLICELHQRAMNSKLFRRSVQANLVELASLDRNLQEQIRANPMQARVDADTKAMLNDFLKASNNFKSGRDVVDCAKMFPKCSRAMLLSTANQHLMDPKNGKAIGKFSNFMKKMKFKSNQQHQSQWKLRKPGKAASLPLAPSGQYQATDHLQVAPMTTIVNGASSKPQVGQVAPVDSLKLVQQIMMMSQQAQQQQPSQAQVPLQSGAASDSPQAYNYAGSNEQQKSNQMYMASNQMTNYQSSYPQQQQQYPQSSTSINGQAAMTNLYTDAIPQMYSPASPTSSPYYGPSQSYPSPEQMSQYQSQYAPVGPGQQLEQTQVQPHQLQSYQQYSAASASQLMPEADKKVQQQQQQQGVTSQQVKPISQPAS